MHRRAVLACHALHDTRSLLGLVLRRSNHVSYPRNQPTPSSSKNNPLGVPKKEYEKAKRSTVKLIERAMSQPHDWKATPTLRGEEMKLRAMLKFSNPQDRKSMEQEAFEQELELEENHELDEIIESSPTLPPGTFIETRRSLILGHGVVVGAFTFGRRSKMVTLMSSGEIWYPSRTDVLFAFQNFLPADLIERCGNDHIPHSPSQANARIEVLRRIREMERKSEFMHNIVSMKSAHVYNKIKSPDPDAWKTTNLVHVARLVSDRPNDMTRFGLHKYIMSNSLHFVADQSYETSRIIFVRPQSHVNNIKTIKEWMRIPNGPIRSFAAKVNKIIPKYQRMQDKSRAELPSYTPATHIWTDDERTILKFLQNSLRQTRSNQADPYSVGVTYILKQINPDKIVDPDDLYQTLTNIGALAPWQDLASLDPSLALDTEPETTSSWTHKQEAIVARGFTSMVPGTNTPLGPEDFHSTDPLESVRHDFGNLPVFVIDDADAKELDDGLSIERIPSEPDNFWLHVHIADPASLIPSTHVLAKEASTRATTTYYIHRTWPLFPKNIMSHPTLGLSLSRKTDKAPLRVLTFSGKVDKMGQLLDYKVRAGLINNLHVITYEQADEVLGFTNNSAWYPFGRKLQPSFKPAVLPDSCVKDLGDLQQVVNRLEAKRFRDGVVLPGRSVATLAPIVAPPPEVYGPLYEPMVFRGFPTFEYSVRNNYDQDIGSHLVVAESMKLACRIASRFCTEHDIPAMRRFADPLPVSSEDMQEILAMRNPKGYVPFESVIGKLQRPSQSGFSLEPKAHHFLGVEEGEGYIRVTSPLRRYTDLAVHWQIHHALLGSKAQKRSPPISAEEMWEIVQAVSAREKTCMINERTHQKFWQYMFVKRWLRERGRTDDSDDMLNNLKGYTVSYVTPNLRSNLLHAQVDVPYLGLIGLVENLPPTSEGLPLGSRLDVRLGNILLGTRPQVIFDLKN